MPKGGRTMGFWRDTIRRLPDNRSEHIVSLGRVGCPIAGDIDVGVCLGCPSLREARLDGVPQVVRCDFVRDAVTLERIAFLRS